MENRDFKGIWIPKEIWLSKDLTIQEKVLLVEIDSFSKSGECFASNKYFADFFGLSTVRISNIISSLISKGFVESKMIYRDGSKEIVKRVLKKTKGGIKENFNRGIKENFKDNNIVLNNTINNTVNKEYQHKKNADVYNSFKEIFLKKYYEISGAEYYFLAKDGAKIKSLIQKIKHAYKTSGNNSPSDEELTNGFIHILNRALNDNWIRNNFSLSIIDSQFNKLKLKKNATREELANAELRELLNSINSGK